MIKMDKRMWFLEQKIKFENCSEKFSGD
jgi:hypothetical protein